MVEPKVGETGRTHDPLAMQKVVGSNPIIRSSRKPRSSEVFLLIEAEPLFAPASIVSF